LPTADGPVVGRLAPTPSGRLHLGNVTAFAAAWLSVRSRNGRLLLRIEDVDASRAVPGRADEIRHDLAWLGLEWDVEVAPQSERDYSPALQKLAPKLYSCTCTRRQLAGGSYPGTCRDAGHPEGALRFRLPHGEVRFFDRWRGAHAIDPNTFGDPVLRRRDGVFAYNLAVVADDIADGVTEVVRGGDLLEFTAVQVRLWEALGARPPTWLHTPLILGADGRKLSKSHGALAIGALRDAGCSAQDLWNVVLPWFGYPKGASLLDAAGGFPDAASDFPVVQVDFGGSDSPFDPIGIHSRPVHGGT
jgi:glutamyl-Q tRNA(Asp) synthetase